VLEAQRRAGESDQEWERRKEQLRIEHGYRMTELGVAGKPPKEAEEPLIKPDGTVNIKHFFDTANTLFPTFTFYDLTDPKMIENAKKKIYDIVISRFAPTANEQGLVSSALDQWFNSLFEIAKNTPDAEKGKPIDWMEFLKRYGKSLGVSLIPGMGPVMAAAQYLTPSGSNVQASRPPETNVQVLPPSGMDYPQQENKYRMYRGRRYQYGIPAVKEGLLQQGLKKAKSLLGF
jgi:hypothetical protein